MLFNTLGPNLPLRDTENVSKDGEFAHTVSEGLVNLQSHPTKCGWTLSWALHLISNSPMQEIYLEEASSGTDMKMATSPLEHAPWTRCYSSPWRRGQGCASHFAAAKCSHLHACGGSHPLLVSGHSFKSSQKTTALGTSWPCHPLLCVHAPVIHVTSIYEVSASYETLGTKQTEHSAGCDLHFSREWQNTENKHAREWLILWQK